MSDRVIAKRLLGFRAGPQNQTFYACDRHRPQLERADVSCFMALPGHPVEPVSEDDAIGQPCYFCAGEDGPRD